MSNYTVNFLEDRGKRRFYKTFNIVLTVTLLANMSLGFTGVGMFFVTPDANACSGAEKECQDLGFDTGIAKWNWDGCKYVPEGGANGTSVTGDEYAANWTADPAVSAVLRKSATDYDIFHGGFDGTINADQHAISHLTFCGACQLELTKVAEAEAVNPGGALDYTLTLANTGTADCTGGGVKLKDIFDDDLIYTSAEPAPDSVTDNYLLWNFGTLKPGDSREVNLTMKVKENSECGAVANNRAKYWSNETDWGGDISVDTPITCEEAVCGDGEVNGNETCELGDFEDCTTADGYAGIHECTGECQWDGDCVSDYYCGDTIVNGNEECDDGPDGSADCTADCRTKTNEPEKTYLTVKKITNGGDASSADWTMYINNDQYSFPGSVSGTVTEVEPGDYRVTESSGPDNYTLAYSGDCDYEGNICLAEGDNKTCVLTNTYQETPEQTGSLVVKKLVVGGEATSSDWTMHVGEWVSFAGTESGKEINIGVGMYQIAESGGPDGYDLSFSGDCSEDGYVSVVSGESHTCILTNTYRPAATTGSIEVCKQIDADGLASTTDDRQLATTTVWTFNLMGDAGTVIGTTTDGCATFDNLKSDFYTLSEVVPAGWQLLVPAENSLMVELGVGEQATEEFVNARTEAAPYCGDGIVNQTSEQCDDGNNTSGDGCSATCQTEGGGGTPNPVCGNGILESGEQCDDGNTASGDGCSATCQTETSGGGGGGGGGLLIPTNRGGQTDGEQTESVFPPVLVIEKSVGQAFANAGDKGIAYKVVVANNGDGTAINTAVVDDLPSGFTFSGTGEATRITNLGDLAPGAIRTIDFNVDIDKMVVAGTYTNTATVSADNHGSVSAIAQLEVRTVVVKGVEMPPVEHLPETGFSTRELVELLLALLLILGLKELASQLLQHKNDKNSVPLHPKLGMKQNK